MTTQQQRGEGARDWLREPFCFGCGEPTENLLVCPECDFAAPTQGDPR